MLFSGLNIKYIEKKNVIFSLHKCYGLSTRSIYCLVSKLGVNLQIKYNKLPFFFKTQIDMYLNFLIEKEFRLKVGKVLKHVEELFLSKLLNLRNLRYVRHKQCLPVRGQRTHSNARTQKNKLKNRLKILRIKVKAKKK
jgi:small subunit ribosomal protein S13